MKIVVFLIDRTRGWALKTNDDPVHQCIYTTLGLNVATDAIQHHRALSTLVQVMSCCLTAPSHYLNQYWLIISNVLWCSLMAISQISLKISILDVRLKITNSRSQPHLPVASGLNYCILCRSILYIHCGMSQLWYFPEAGSQTVWYFTSS